MKTITLTVSDDATITVDGKEYVPKELDTPTKPDRELWTPKFEGEYWYIAEDGQIYDDKWDGVLDEPSMLASGNVFPTREHAAAAKRHREAQSVIDRHCYVKGIDTRWKEGVHQLGVYLASGSLVLSNFTEPCDGSPFWVESKEIAEQIIADCPDEIRAVLLRGYV